LCQVAEFEIGRRVFSYLFPETTLELQKVVVDPRADDGKRIVDVGEDEERFALDVGGGYVDWVEGGRVVVEDPEEVVVVPQEALVFLA
jgi:hypothetical protein